MAQGPRPRRWAIPALSALVGLLGAYSLILWTDGTGTSLPRLVRQAMAEQLAMAVGVQAGDLDPEAD